MKKPSAGWFFFIINTILITFLKNYLFPYLCIHYIYSKIALLFNLANQIQTFENK